MLLTSKAAVVTGSTSGIGLACARALAKEGANVVLNGFGKPEEIEAARAGIEAEFGVKAIHSPADMSKPDEIARMIATAEETFGRLDVLVNNAGIAHVGNPGRSVAEVAAAGQPSVAAVDAVRAVFETNVFGVLAVTQAMLPLLRQAPAARVVNVSSSVGSLTRNADPANPYRAVFGAAYGPSKTALNAITLAFAIELESTGIKVNAACPGYTATDLNNFEGFRTVEQAAREPVRLALLDADGPTGTFSNEDGQIAW